jgi:hypothetical protein
MGSLRLRIVVLAGIVMAVLVSTPGTGAAGTKDCVAAILEDWRNGPIGGHYSPECYRAALASLPEDMRIYSTASDDIESALHVRLAALAGQRARTAKATKRKRVLSVRRHAGHVARNANRRPARAALAGDVPGDAAFPVPVVVAAAAAAVLVGLAGVSQAARLMRRR